MTIQISRTFRLVVAALQIVWLGGCVNIPYYAQAVSGHIDVMRRAQPISKVIADPNVDQQLRQTLSQIVLIRAFASHELKLPKNRSYMSYADLQRPYAVWNVFASPELSLELKQWCFIKAGCVNYRGFFSQTAAERYAEKLKNQGYDVYVGGIRAYSTLGWFNDPILNTFIGYSEIELAGLIFHELAHQVLYVPGDSVFNESFATTVEHEGVGRWFESNGSVAERAEFKARQERKTVFVELILKHRMQLIELFSTDISDAEMRAAKARVFEDLREEFTQLKAAKTEFSSYDRWFAQELNNARLATVSIYTQLLPEFQALLTQQNRDMAQFYKVVKEISKLPKNERNAALQAAVANSVDAEILSDASLGNISENSNFQIRQEANKKY